MLSWIGRHSNNATIAALIASALAIVTSIGSAAITYYYSTATQDRQAKLEQLSKFESSSAQIIEAGGQFIVAINAKQDLEGPRTKLKSVLAAQIYDTETLKRFFGDARVLASITNYQKAIDEFDQTAGKTGSYEDMRPWAESFGRVLDSKSDLGRELYGSVGVEVRVPNPGNTQRS